MFKTIKQFFVSNKDKRKRNVKDLLRENLSLVPIDIFYIDDPILKIADGEKRLMYYKKFFDICADADVMERIKYLINKQARLTLQSSRDGTATEMSDELGAGCINGLASIKDDFEKLGNSYLKETAPTTDFNKHKII